MVQLESNHMWPNSAKTTNNHREFELERPVLANSAQKLGSTADHQNGEAAVVCSVITASGVSLAADPEAQLFAFAIKENTRDHQDTSHEEH